jgi:hypothetical protein
MYSPGQTADRAPQTAGYFHPPPAASRTASGRLSTKIVSAVSSTANGKADPPPPEIRLLSSFAMNASSSKIRIAKP